MSKKALLDFGVSGLTIGSLTWNFCRTAGGAPVNTAGSTLTELGAIPGGRYELDVPAAVDGVSFEVYITADQSNYQFGVFIDEATEATSAAILAAVGGSGTGTEQANITITTDDLVPVGIPDVQITIMDNTNTVLVANITTNPSGVATTAINPATYKLRLRKAGTSFTVPETMVVVSSGIPQSFSYMGTAITISPAITPGMQVIYGNVRRLNWVASTGDRVTCSVAAKKMNAQGALIQTNELSTTVDANGIFQFTVPQDSTVTIMVENHGSHTIKTNNEATYDVADYLNGVLPPAP